jgi:hypothetical protein
MLSNIKYFPTDAPISHQWALGAAARVDLQTLFLEGGAMTSKQERDWLKKFYEGTFLVKGWKAQVKELLEDFQGEERDTANDLLSDLGEKIGREWSKDNAVRRIDTVQLKQWGAGLTSARKKGPEALIAEIRAIDQAVNGMLG